MVARLKLQRENDSKQTEMQTVLGLLSRLCVLAGIRLRKAVEVKAKWKEKRPVMLLQQFQQVDT